jgi:hypothetical protein
MDEVAPGGVTGDKDAAEDFPGMIVESQNECGIMFGEPPLVREGVVLPEFANGGALPAAARLGAAFERGHQRWELLPDIGGHGSAGTLETEPAFQFIGQQGKIQGLAVRQYLSQEQAGLVRPVRTVIPTGVAELKAFLVQQPLMTQFIEACLPNHQSFGSRGSIHLASVEGREDFLNK